LRDSAATPDAIAIATGSEVQLAMAAAQELAQEGIQVRVVSMPNVGRFYAQDAAYREQLLPASVSARVAIEAGVTAGWLGLVGPRGAVLGVDRFGASAPAPQLFEHYGLTVANVCATIRSLLNPDSNPN
jgi:transketolase